MREQNILHNGMLWKGKLSCKSFFFRVLPRKLLNSDSTIEFEAPFANPSAFGSSGRHMGLPLQTHHKVRLGKVQCAVARSRCKIRPKPIAVFGLKLGLFCAAFAPFFGSAAAIPEIVPQVQTRFSGSTFLQNPPEANRGVWYEDPESEELPASQNGKNRDIFPKSSSPPSFHVRYIGNSPSALGTFIFLSTLCLGCIVLSRYRRRKKKE
jgi:hypothetical protein